MRLILAAVLFLLPVSSFAEVRISATTLLDPSFEPPNNHLILVDMKTKTIKYYQDYKLIKEYRIAIGKPKTPTPVGSGYIRSKGKMIFRYWTGPKKGKIKKYSRLKDGRLVKIDYSKMFGLGITIPGYHPYQYYIHSTTEENTIGTAASKGCIRMKIKDMLELFPLVELGTKIIIKPPPPPTKKPH